MTGISDNNIRAKPYGGGNRYLMMINFEKLKDKLVGDKQRVQMFFFSGLAIFGTSFATVIAAQTGWRGFTTPFIIILIATLAIMYLYLKGFLIRLMGGFVNKTAR